jgi:hypothetical protein
VGSGLNADVRLSSGQKNYGDCSIGAGARQSSLDRFIIIAAMRIFRHMTRMTKPYMLLALRCVLSVKKLSVVGSLGL